MSSWLICICIYSWCIYNRCRDSCNYFDVWVRDSCNYFDLWVRDSYVYVYIRDAYTTDVVTHVVISRYGFVTHVIISTYGFVTHVYIYIFAMHTQQVSWLILLVRDLYSSWLIQSLHCDANSTDVVIHVIISTYEFVTRMYIYVYSRCIRNRCRDARTN